MSDIQGGGLFATRIEKAASGVSDERVTMGRIKTTAGSVLMVGTTNPRAASRFWASALMSSAAV